MDRNSTNRQVGLSPLFGPHAVVLGEEKKIDTKLSKLLRSDDCLALPNEVPGLHLVVSKLVAQPKQTVFGLVVRDYLIKANGLEFSCKPASDALPSQLQFSLCDVWNFDLVFHKQLCCCPPMIVINLTPVVLTRQGEEFAEEI